VRARELMLWLVEEEGPWPVRSLSFDIKSVRADTLNWAGLVSNLTRNSLTTSMCRSAISATTSRKLPSTWLA
jgi:hypothetical protein